MHQRNENEVETFTLQMTDIVMIEKGSYTSFTFAVLKDNDDGKMENVTVNYYTNGDIKAYLVVYDINDYEKELLRQGITISLDEKTKTFLLENLVDNESEQNEIVARLRDVKMCTQWVTQNTICKGELKHDITNFFECEYFQNGTWTPVVTTLEFVPCPDGGGGSGGGDGGYIPPGDDYPVGGGPDNDDPAEEDEFEGQITWPVIPKTGPKTPCENSKEITNPNNTRNALEEINDLKNKLLENIKIEHAYSLKNDGNHLMTTGTPTRVEIFTGTDYFSSIHLHPREGVPMFSFRDLYLLYNTRRDASLQNMVQGTSIMLVVNESNNNSINQPVVYALHLTNPNLFYNYIENRLASTELNGIESLEKKLDQLDLIFSQIYNTSNPNKAAMFLQNIAGKGLKLMKASNDLSIWFECEILNPGPNAIIFTVPCN